MTWDDFADAPKAAPASWDSFPDASEAQSAGAAQKLAEDPKFDPVQFAAENPNARDFALKAYAIQEARPKSLMTAVGNFGKAIPGGLKAIPEGVANTAVNVLESANPLDDPEQRQKSQARAVIQGQMTENRTVGMLDSIKRVLTAGADKLIPFDANPNEDPTGSFADNPNSVFSKNPPAESTGELFQPIDHAKRIADEFDQKVARARTDMQLASGRPIDQGAIAGLVKGASFVGSLGRNTFKPSEVTMTPEQMSAAGVPWTSADADISEKGSQGTDPTMLIPLHVPVLGPLAAKAAGALVEGGGRALSTVGDTLLAKGARRLGPGAVIGAGIYGGLPGAAAAAVAGSATWTAGKGLGIIGDIAKDAGQEARTGIPGEMSSRLGAATVNGTSDITAAMKQRIGRALVGGVAAPLAMAPLNAILSEGDPEKFGTLEGGTVGIGMEGGATGGFSFKGARFNPDVQNNVGGYLAKEGAKPTGNDALDAMHDTWAKTADPMEVHRVNMMRGMFNSLPVDANGQKVAANIYVAPDAQAFANELQKKGVTQDPAELAKLPGWFKQGTAIINGGIDGGQGGDIASHEGTHIAAQTLDLMMENGHPLNTYLQSALQNGLTNPDGTPNARMKDFIAKYKAGAAPEEQSRPDNDPYWTHEFLADVGAQVIAKHGPAYFAISEETKSTIVKNIGTALGKLTGTQSYFSPQNVDQVSAIHSATSDMLSNIVGMKFRNKGLLDALKVAQAVPEAADTAPLSPRTTTKGGEEISLPEAMAKKVQPTSDLREAMRKQASQPSEAPAAPPAAPDAFKQDVAAALVQLGIPKMEAVIWAEGAQGNDLGDAVSKVLAARAARKYGRPAKPGQPSEQPAEATQKDEPKDVLVSEEPAPGVQGVPVPDAPFPGTGRQDATLPAKPKAAEVLTPEQLSALPNLKPEDAQKVLALQDNIGKRVFIDYNAPGRGDSKFTAETRRKEVKDAPPDARLVGEAPATMNYDKSFIPIRSTITKAGNVNVLGYSWANVVKNLGEIVRFASSVGEKTGYEGDLGQAQDDLEAAMANHANGIKGDGSGPFKGFLDTEAPKPNPDFAPIPVDPLRYQALNMAMNDETALKSGAKKAETAAKANEAINLARENGGYLNQQTGEVNALRDRLKAKGFESKQLETAVENIRPEHVIGDVRPEARGGDSLRQNLFPGAATMPNGAMARAGFMSASLLPKAAESAGYSPEIEAKLSNDERARIGSIDRRLVGGNAGGTPEGNIDEAASFIRGGVRAGASGSGSLNQRQLVIQWAEKAGRLIEAPQGSLYNAENIGGSEHDVYHDGSTGRWIKAGSTGFGIYPAVMNTINGSWDMRSASPLEYLDRLKLSNELFGDHFVLHAIQVTPEGKVLPVISQPDIQGEKIGKDFVSQVAFEKAMARMGFEDYGDSVWYRASDNTAIFDAHDQNVLKNGKKLRFIDVIPMHPSKQLLAEIEKGQHSPNGEMLDRMHAMNVKQSLSRTLR